MENKENKKYLKYPKYPIVTNLRILWDDLRSKYEKANDLEKKKIKEEMEALNKLQIEAWYSQMFIFNEELASWYWSKNMLGGRY